MSTVIKNNLKHTHTNKGKKTICSSRVPSGPLLVFINKVLLEHSYSHSFTYCGWLLLPPQTSVATVLGLQSQKYLLCSPLHKIGRLGYNAMHFDLLKTALQLPPQSK